MSEAASALKRMTPFSSHALALSALEKLIGLDAGEPSTGDDDNPLPEYTPRIRDYLKQRGPSFWRYRVRRYNVFLGDNGAIRIVGVSGNEVLDMQGSDGFYISQLRIEEAL